jgi:hypothetical protein
VEVPRRDFEEGRRREHKELDEEKMKDFFA